MLDVEQLKYRRAQRRVTELNEENDRLRERILDLITLAGVTCALVDRCQLYGYADALRGAVVDLRQMAETAIEEIAEAAKDAE